MNFNVYDALEWQFVSNQQSMSVDLDETNGAALALELFADADVRIVLTASDGSELFFWEGRQFQGEVHLLNFVKAEIRSRKTTHYAVKIRFSGNIESEFNDGEPALLSPDDTPDMRIDAEVQQRIIHELMAAGFSAEDTMDILTGLNSDDDELLLEDDDDLLPSEAEMSEMIAEARKRAAEALLESEDVEPSEEAEEASSAATDAQDD